jgi:hypothetical protein
MKKRIYYVPGILTLAIAPVLFMARTNKYIADRTQHCISIIVAEKNDSEHVTYMFPERAYQTYFLTGQNKKDSLNLILLENFARGICLSNNDSVGLKVVLSKGIKYSQFIGLLNACLKSGINNWIPKGDTVFIFNRNCKDQNDIVVQNARFDWPTWNDGFCVPEAPNKEPSLIQKIKNEKEMIIRGGPILLLIIIMAFSSLRQIFNEGKNEK